MMKNEILGVKVTYFRTLPRKKPSLSVVLKRDERCAIYHQRQLESHRPPPSRPWRGPAPLAWVLNPD